MDSTVSTGAAAMMAIRVLLVGTSCGEFDVDSLGSMGSRDVSSCPLSDLLGSRRPGGQDLLDFIANGRNGCPLRGVRIPAGPHHHHCRG